jgi:DNA-binding NarL/FixJ family response regulator
MSDSTIRVLVADDDHMARSKLEDLLSSRPEDGIAVVGQAVNVTEALEQWELLQPDVVVLDLCMPEAAGEMPLAERGIGAIQELRQCCPDVRVLVVSVVGESPYLRRALAVGAGGYVLKDDVDTLPNAIKAVARGDTFISACLAGRHRSLLASGRSQIGQEYGLTDRELDVWIEIVKEPESISDPNVRIASRLNVSSSRVRNCVSSLLAQFGFPGDRGALRKLGEEKGLGLM